MQNIKQNSFSNNLLKNALLAVYTKHIQAKICHERFAIKAFYFKKSDTKLNVH